MEGNAEKSTLDQRNACSFKTFQVILIARNDEGSKREGKKCVLRTSPLCKNKKWPRGDPYLVHTSSVVLALHACAFARSLTS
jgi:hypothetical protein